MIDLVTKLNQMLLEDAPLDELGEACWVIDMSWCDPIVEPPQEVLDEWARNQELGNLFTCTVERKIGNTRFVVDTGCDGTELLTSKVKRLLFSGREAG